MNDIAFQKRRPFPKTSSASRSLILSLSKDEAGAAVFTATKTNLSPAGLTRGSMPDAIAMTP